MLVRTHLMFALCLLLLLLKMGMPFSLPAILVALFASLLVDIDMPYSFIGKRTRPLSNIFYFFAKHRGFFHSLTAAIIFSFAVFFFDYYMAFFFFLGYFSHIFADAFTKAGVKFFWPSKLMIKGPIRTGSFFENFIFIALIIINIVFAIILL